MTLLLDLLSSKKMRKLQKRGRGATMAAIYSEKLWGGEGWGFKGEGLPRQSDGGCHE